MKIFLLQLFTGLLGSAALFVCIFHAVLILQGPVTWVSVMWLLLLSAGIQLIFWATYGAVKLLESRRNIQ